MSWRDFLYYSKGERRGLIVLLCLITIGGILMILDNKSLKTDKRESQQNSVIANNQSEGSNSSNNFINQSEQEMITKDLSSNDRNTRPNFGSNANDNSSNKTTVRAGNEETIPAEKKESVTERIDRLTSYSRPSYPRSNKFSEGTIVELNTADTTVLKKVPGIGSAFAKRIVSYRNLLGGFYSVTQLSEVYGIDEDRYASLKQWFNANPDLISKLELNKITQESLNKHPYINYNQSRVIIQLRKQKGKLTGWENLQLLNEFTDVDKIRLQHYLSYE